MSETKYVRAKRCRSTRQRKRIVVPYCVDGELELFWLEDMSELELGMYKILEPKAELRTVEKKRLGPQDLDLIMVPGVAFDRTGGRTGARKRLLRQTATTRSPRHPLIALAFECQMFEEIPAEAMTSIWTLSSQNQLLISEKEES